MDTEHDAEYDAEDYYDTAPQSEEPFDDSWRKTRYNLVDQNAEHNAKVVAEWERLERLGLMTFDTE